MTTPVGRPPDDGDGAPEHPGQQYPVLGHPPPPVWGPPPPPHWPQPAPPENHRGKIIALVTVIAVVLAGLGLGGFLLLRGGGTVTPADFQPVRTPSLVYAVPPDWTTTPQGGFPQTFGVTFQGAAEAPGYSCGGADFVRGTVSSALIVDASATPVEVAQIFAQGLGRRYYTGIDGSPPQVALGAPEQREVDGVPATLVEATATTPSDDGCLATTGTVLVLAIPTTSRVGEPAVAVFVVNGDVSGGPADPPSPSRTTLEQILAGVHFTGT
ncbi:hypothetical protein [Pseudonocardia asaccharolytica]|uniref:DUF8017 domain-containing protein n=1 Tax=Pseudonocardia asaccharolytica DSM 44247 = NBRC 16224 TaxID=1123024 RepID=A0A511D4J0_9PSEU|nr:hypothetical protein [Pseudonocardia asaccharolytica]GEL17838.1 hypothetical protein PA7_16750 [Pseudonocardia asaccharolytica DSM 44247 = NBRC 16224]